MLKWCAYCQQFQGEVRPFEDFAVSHGMCLSCKERGIDLSDQELNLSLKLKAVQQRLWAAGKREDVEGALKILEDAEKEKMRAVDVFVGVMAPLLYKIGEQWKAGEITVADEHRFTSFCERVFKQIEAARRTAENPEVLLANIPGNRHTLAVRILALWLNEKGVRAKAICPEPSIGELKVAIEKHRPKLLLLSGALAEHREGAVKILEMLASLAPAPPPKVYIGGYSVRMGMFAPVDNAELVADINELRF